MHLTFVYWGQIAVALAVALLSGYVTLRSGQTAVIAAIVGTVTYVLTRWAIAWAYRVRFWYSTGRKDRSRSCPDCGGYIYRQRGDWFLQCKRCGWTEGWPAVRWVTRSVPARQLRRTVVGPKLVLVVILAGLLASGLLTGLTPADIDDQLGNADESADEETPRAGTGDSDRPDSSDSRSASTSTEDRGYDQTAVREAFLSRLNEERSSRGLQTLALQSELTEMGEDHTANMAEHEYVGHVWPDGTTIEDRYRARGLLPECRLGVSGSNRYYPGAENAAGAWIDRRFHSSGGSYYVSNEAELGQTLVDIWISSPPHRRAMLVGSADEMGLGLNITGQGQVYAALELC